MIGKRAAEHGVVANLCIPDHFILVVTLHVNKKYIHVPSFFFKALDVGIMVDGIACYGRVGAFFR